MTAGTDASQESPPTEEGILYALASKHVGTRLKAANVAHRNPTSKVQATLQAMMVTDPNDHVRSQCVRTLANSAWQGTLEERLTPALSHPHVATRAAVAHAIPPRVENLAFVVRVYAGGDADTRIAAVHAVLAIAIQDKLPERGTADAELTRYVVEQVAPQQATGWSQELADKVMALANRYGGPTETEAAHKAVQFISRVQEELALLRAKALQESGPGSRPTARSRGLSL